MKLIRLGESGDERAGVLLKDGARLDATGFGSDYNEAFFESGGLAELGSWIRKSAASAARGGPNPRYKIDQ